MRELDPDNSNEQTNNQTSEQTSATNNQTNEQSRNNTNDKNNRAEGYDGVSQTDDGTQANADRLGQRGNDLRPLAPEKGVESFLDLKRSELDSLNTFEKYRRRLSHLLKFFDKKGIDNLNEANLRIIREFRIWRRTEGNDKDGDLGQKTMRDDMYLLRDFVEHAEATNAIEQGISDSIRIPKLSGDDGISNEFLDPERAQNIEVYIEKYNYGSRDHAVWVIYNETGRRISCLIALDLRDFGYDEHGPYLQFKHRPETELKNDEESNARIYIDDRVAEVLEDYISENRIDILDEHGRNPLLTTDEGRISSSTLRKTAYKYTRPCEVGNECPHDKVPKNCVAKQRIDDASKCPSSRSPHDIRHGFATACRRRGITPVELSNRFDASPEVIEKHYEETTPKERAKARKPLFDEFREEGGGFL